MLQFAFYAGTSQLPKRLIFNPHTLRFTFILQSSMVFEKCIVAHIHHYSITENNSISLCISCSSFHLSLLPTPRVHYCEYFLYSLPLLEIDIKWNNIAAFSDWLLSHRNKHLWFIHVFSWFDSWHLIADSIPLSGCASLSTYLLKNILIASNFWRL